MRNASEFFSKTRGVRTPLIGKFLVWLLLNLLLLGAAFFFFFHAQFKFELDALMAGPVGDRVRAVTRTIVSALRSSPKNEWDDVLRSFGDAYKVDFALLDADGKRIAASSAQEFPHAVLTRVAERRGLGRIPPRASSVETGTRKPWGETNPPSLILARFTLKTERPTRYWVALRVPSPQDPGKVQSSASEPWTLLLVTDSLYSSGLLLDISTWMLTGAGAVALSVVLWIPLVRGLTKSVSELKRATNEIASGNFAVRVPESRSDELGQLGHAVNRMADRLDGFVTGQKRFLGDTAHELCSPIARMQVALAILDESASPEQKGFVRDLREEVEEMSSLINELLSFSKASLAGPNAPLEATALAVIVREAVHRENGSANGIDVCLREQTWILARPDLLRRAVANLVRNAIRHAGSAGQISIRDEDEDEHVLLTVQDRGPGVDEIELQRIFDPFYRPEQSRSRETGGSGLGLAIVKTCAEACDGSVSATNLKPQGFQVQIRLRRAEIR